jgi:CubicO group peptidase (beta-lactamase class C family)
MVDQKQVKGAIVSIISNGTNELCKGYGFADEEKGIAAHEDNTAFRIGSISKTFVAVAAQQLSRNGKLDMNASVDLYLEEDFPKFKYDMTMNDLLTHTAGFEDMFSGIAAHDISKAEPLELSIRKYIPAQVFVPGEVVS